jgi:hypothetical protein
MRSSLIAIGAMVFTVVEAGNASAQGFGIYVGPGPGYAYEDSYGYGPRAYGYGPRVYGYSRRFEEREPTYRRLRPAGHCGEYRFWDGDACVDARNR